MISSRIQSVALAIAALAGIALASSSAAVADDLSGFWGDGHWASHCTRHHGPLKADFYRINASQYEVRFKGRFFGIIPPFAMQWS